MQDSLLKNPDWILANNEAREVVTTTFTALSKAIIDLDVEDKNHESAVIQRMSQAWRKLQGDL